MDIHTKTLISLTRLDHILNCTKQNEYTENTSESDDIQKLSSIFMKGKKEDTKMRVCDLPSTLGKGTDTTDEYEKESNETASYLYSYIEKGDVTQSILKKSKENLQKLGCDKTLLDETTEIYRGGKNKETRIDDVIHDLYFNIYGSLSDINHQNTIYSLVNRCRENNDLLKKESQSKLREEQEKIMKEINMRKEKNVYRPEERSLLSKKLELTNIHAKNAYILSRDNDEKNENRKEEEEDSEENITSVFENIKDIIRETNPKILPSHSEFKRRIRSLSVCPTFDYSNILKELFSQVIFPCKYTRAFLETVNNSGLFTRCVIEDLPSDELYIIDEEKKSYREYISQQRYTIGSPREYNPKFFEISKIILPKSYRSRNVEGCTFLDEFANTLMGFDPTNIRVLHDIMMGKDYAHIKSGRIFLEYHDKILQENINFLPELNDKLDQLEDGIYHPIKPWDTKKDDKNEEKQHPYNDPYIFLSIAKYITNMYLFVDLYRNTWSNYFKDLIIGEIDSISKDGTLLQNIETGTTLYHIEKNNLYIYCGFFYCLHGKKNILYSSNNYELLLTKMLHDDINY